VKLHQHETFQHLQQVLANRLINTFALICVVGLPVSLYRWFELGFQPIFIQHIALSLIVLIAFVWGLIPAIIYLGLWCLFIIGLEYLFTQNIIQYQIDPAIYAYMPSAWAIVIIGTLITALFILIMGSAFYRAFDAMLLEVYEQKQQADEAKNNKFEKICIINKNFELTAKP
jgi:hypothetical protein